jgi:hypothetical protein
VKYTVCIKTYLSLKSKGEHHQAKERGRGMPRKHRICRLVNVASELQRYTVK